MRQRLQVGDQGGKQAAPGFLLHVPFQHRRADREEDGEADEVDVERQEDDAERQGFGGGGGGDGGGSGHESGQVDRKRRARKEELVNRPDSGWRADLPVGRGPAGAGPSIKRASPALSW